MSNAPFKKIVTSTVSVADEDIKCFKELYELGVSIYSQMVPSAERLEFMPLMEKAINK
jgi:mannose/fructose/N-acetylgalactosamine-specific phosphotransferase system component IIB